MTEQSISKEPRYNLSFIIQETDTKADTLRAWERRYQLPQPQRTDGGHRLFSEYDIQTIKWLNARKKEGMSISRAVCLWREIESRGSDPLSSPSTDPFPQPILDISTQGVQRLADLKNGWVKAALNFDGTAAEQLLTQAFAQFPMETVCVEIIQSGLSTIGTLWYQGVASVQQEHFASELANQRLHSLIAAAPQSVRDKTILVALPPGENHTFSALLITLFLRYRSWQVIYLGANVPQERLQETIENTKPDLVVMAAMRLETSVTLSETTAFLKDMDVPTAFGGWIFNQISGLAQKVPGHYLGEDVLEAISNIEKLLINGMPLIQFPSILEEYSETISHFIENRYQLETQTLESIQEKLGKDIPIVNIQEANAYLAQDIIAALHLGDLSIVNSDLDWVESLIANHETAGDMLFNYLLAYYEAAQTHLGEAGGPIIEWLASIIQSKT